MADPAPPMSAAALRQLLRTELPALLREDPSVRDELLGLLEIGPPPATRQHQTLWDALEELTKRVDKLAEAQARTEKRIEELAQAQTRTERRLARLVDRVADIDGRVLEADYARKAPAIFGPFLAHTRVLDPGALADALARHLDKDELADALQVDLVVSGTPRGATESQELWVAVEISSVLDATDLERAVRRAALLRKAGQPVVAALAGRRLDADIEARAQAARVVTALDGRVQGWPEALATAAPARGAVRWYAFTPSPSRLVRRPRARARPEARAAAYSST
ncbi:MAG: hypothetical protein HY744_14485 [Deltaproteobacteria bacterium]|nr:hypothetical protein [Deltaproteobacteria bacterium]